MWWPFKKKEEAETALIEWDLCSTNKDQIKEAQSHDNTPTA